MDIQPSHPGGQVPRRPSPDYSRVVERAQEIRQSAGKPMSEALDQAFEEARQPPQASAPANVDELLADPARWPHHMDAWCSVHAWLAYRPLREVEAVLTGAGIDGINLSLLLPLSSTTAHADALGFAPMSPQLVASVARCARVLELKQQIQAEGYGDFLAVEEEARELRAFCVRRKDVLVIAFRGTVTCSNWRDDFRCWPVREAPRRHRGFLGCWRALAPRITDWVRAQAPRTPRLVVTGHSLGGALAILAASDLMCAGIAGLRIEAVSLFGCPRVGLAGFADAYGKARAGAGEDAPSLAQVTRRNISGADLVARVPPPLAYRHVGTGYLIKDDGIHEGESSLAVTRIGAFLRRVSATLWPRPEPLPAIGALGRTAQTSDTLEAMIPQFLPLLLSYPLTIAGLGLAALLGLHARDAASHFHRGYVRRFRNMYPAFVALPVETAGWRQEIVTGATLSVDRDRAPG